MADFWTEKYKFIHRLEGVVNGLSGEIAETLDGALDKVAGKIIVLESKASDTSSYIRKKKYLDQQKASIEKVLDEVYQDIGGTIKERSVELAQESPKIIDTLIKKSAGNITVKMSVPTLSKKVVNAWFESSRIEGLYFNDWVKKLESGTVTRIIKETRESMVLAEHKTDTVKRIQNALDVGRKSASGLAHNCIHTAHNWGERQYFQENQKRFKSLRFTAELDRRTTPLCRSLDGKEFPVGEAPQPPLHWLCRSYLTPIFKNEALNKALHESKGNIRIARIDTEGRWINHRDGTRSKTFDKLRVKHPHTDMNYNQWMSSMVESGNPADRSFAQEVLGPTRFGLVESGKLKMKSLYYHGKLRTIKELKELIK